MVSKVCFLQRGILMIKDKEVRLLHLALVYTNRKYRQEKIKLKQCISLKKACLQAGYLQHYPEFDQEIGYHLTHLRSLKRELRENARQLKEILYQEVS